MNLPIRVRLTAWYVLVLAAIFVAIGAFLVVQLRSDLQDKTDSELRSDALQLARDYRDEGPADFLDVSRTVLPPDGAAQVLDSEGRVLHTFGRVAAPTAMVGPDVQAAAQRSDSPVHTITLGARHEHYRVVALPAARLGRGDLVVAAASLDADEEAINRLLILLAIAGPAALLATGLGGWLLARQALAPVQRMTSQAARIGIDDLDERIAVPRVEDEVGHLAVTLNAMLDRLENGVRDKQRLIADASHELRTPLAVMRAELDVSLRGDDLTPAAREVLESAREEVDRMSRTVSNLLTLAAVDEGLRPLADAKGMTLTLNGDPCEAQADPQRLHQALTNFIENAIKFSPADGEVRVGAWQRDGEVGVTVADDGPGIPSDARAHVFDRFYRVDGARGRAVGGSGLGLAICREVAVAHGGRVWVDSEEGAGSAFSLALPAEPGD